jgi:hypothetical protein
VNLKNLIAISLIAAAALPAKAVTLFNNGPAVNDRGLSVARPGGAIFGFTAEKAAPGYVGGPNNWVADNFTVVGDSWIVEDFSFFAYQGGAATKFTFTDVAWSVVAGDVQTGTVVASGTTLARSGGLLGYRVEPKELTNTDRAIYQINTDVPDFQLAAGKYWLRWTFIAFPFSEAEKYRYQPPVFDAKSGNANISRGGNPYVWAMDPGDNLGNEFPFVINGTVNPVPEPATSALMLGGALAVAGVVRRRRKAS